MKRLLQTCNQQPVPFVCGVLILVSELIKQRPEVFKVVDSVVFDDDEDDEEKCVDAVEESDTDNALTSQEENVKRAIGHKGHVTATSWLHRKLIKCECCKHRLRMQ